MKIDLEGISQRILALPIPAKNYVNLVPGKSGILFLSEGPTVITEDDQPTWQSMHTHFGDAPTAEDVKRRLDVIRSAYRSGDLDPTA